jgi:hypothetical protein
MSSKSARKRARLEQALRLPEPAATVAALTALTAPEPAATPATGRPESAAPQRFPPACKVIYEYTHYPRHD